ncbi:MAG: hypothetical protein E4H18_01835, partial [Hyphomicrobiales bacterium]
MTELLARVRIAILALAPDESSESPPEAISVEAAARAAGAIGALLAELESQDDTLRALLAVDMALAVDEAPSASGRSRGKLAALLVQALSVLADDPLIEGGADSFAPRSPLALANELRALRGAPLLSGNVVFAIAVDAGTPANAEPVDADPRMAASARRLRSFYQQGLIAWLGGGTHARAGAARIGEVFARLHVLSQGTAQEPLWRTAASFATLLNDVSWRMSTAVKRLLGQLDGQLKRLGEGANPVPEPVPTLVQDLLFYLSEGHDVDATIGVFPSRSALLEAFAAPPRAHPDQPTAVLSVLNELLAISAQLMEALAPGESWIAKRSWLTERMLHACDALGLLGAHALRHRALAEIGLLRKTPGTGDPPPGGWGRMAERLHALGAELLTTAGMKPAAAVAEDTAGMPSGGHIARRLEADLVHAEGVIQRLEQGRASLPAEPPGQASIANEDEDEAAGAAGFRHRLDEFADNLRSESHDRASQALAQGSTQGLATVAFDHELLDDILHFAGEIDGSRSRLEQQVGAFREGLQDMDHAIRGLREELDQLRSHAEAQRPPHAPADAGKLSAGVSAPQAGWRERLQRLASAISGLSELRDSIDGIASDSRSLLVQQARDHVALEQRLMHSRMQPLDGQLQQLSAEIAERAAHAGKQVLLRVDAGGLRVEPEKMAALLPVLRSLTVSMTEAGVEPPRTRVLAGRPPGCLMDMRFKRRGADLNMILSADCKAPAPGAVAEAQAFLRPLGGLLELRAAGSFETLCSLRMPLAPRLSTVLLVAVGGEILALPLADVAAVLQVSAETLEAAEQDGIEHDDERWRLGHLSTLLALGEKSPPGSASRWPLVLVASDSGRHALVVDAIGERVDVVVRSVAPQLRALGGLAGAA